VAGTQAKARAQKLDLRPYLEAAGLRDMAAETAEAPLLAQLLLDSGRASRQEISKVTEEEITSWTARLLPLAGKLLLHGHSLEEMLALGREWHIPGNALPDGLRPLRGGRWHAVIPEIPTPARFRNAEGKELPITVKALTSQAELARESEQLHHCVGTAAYGTQCCQGKTHILSFQAGGQSLATMEVSIAGDAQAPLSNVQFRGKDNGKPLKEAALAWQWLEEQMKNGKQKLNPVPQGGWGEITMKDPPPAVRTIGDWPSELLVNRFYRHLQERLKVKVAAVTDARGGGVFWTARLPKEGYRWRQALIPIREGFNGIIKRLFSKACG
jgi:hypothetical protein